MTTFFRHNFFMVFGIMLSIIAILVVSPFFGGKDETKINIVKNGIEVEAEITSYDAFIIVDKEFYQIYYKFLDENGHSHSGISTEYMYLDIKEYLDSNTIPIKYDPRTYESVEAFYGAIDLTFVINLISSIVCWGATAVLLFFGIKKGMNNFKEEEVLAKGYDYTARVQNMLFKHEVMGVHYYKLKYTWTGENGVEYIGFDNVAYPPDEIEVLKKNMTVPIKALGKHSFVRGSIDLKTVKKYKKEIKCKFCGEHFFGVKCPKCGSFIDNKE